ncbi:hypothetical protein ABTL60_19390, partial [Acinetobacter baumannii]
MLSFANMNALSRDLAQSSDRQLVKIVGIIDNMSDRGGLDAAVDRVRHRLAVIRPARPLTLARLLFNPVEDLLD